MNLDLSMSRRKSRGELAAIFARLPAKNQPAPPALRVRCFDAPSGNRTSEALRNPHSGRSHYELPTQLGPRHLHLHIADGLK
jgi:hypothetical protein